MRPALARCSLGATCIALSPIFVAPRRGRPDRDRVLARGAGCSALWLVVLAATPQRARRYSGKWPLLLAAGFAFAGDLAFWHSSIQLTSVANSTLLANLASIFVTLAAWIFLAAAARARMFLAGLAAALAGVVLLVHTSLAFSSHRACSATRSAW